MKHKLLIVFITSLIAVLNGYAQNNLWIDTVSASSNQIIRFDVEVANAQPFTALQLDIQLPSTLSYIDSSAVLDQARTVDHSIFVSKINNQTIRIVTYSANLSNFNGSTGSVIHFNCKTGTTAGNYSLTILNPSLGNTSGKNILTNYYNGLFVLLAPQIEINSNTFKFGKVPLGQSQQQNLTITNNGTTQLNILKLSSNSSEIKFLDSSAISIAPGNSISRSIIFAPVSKGSKNVQLTILSNDPSDSVQIITSTGTGYTINEIHLSNINARSGYETVLSVSINNMEPFTAFEFTIQLPSVLQYEFGSGAFTSRKADQLLAIDTIANNQLKVLAYSTTNTNFSGSDGDILDLKFHASGNPGNYAISVVNPVISTSQGENIISAYYGSSLQIVSPKISVNNSNIDLGKVSVRDTSIYSLQINNYGSDTLIISGVKLNNSYFICENKFPLIIAAGSSQSVQIKFHSGIEGLATALLQIYSNDVTNYPLPVNISATAYEPNILILNPVRLFKDERGVVSISLSNMKPAAGMQFDLTLPPNITVKIDSVLLTQRKVDHVFFSSALGNNAYRIICYSPTLKSFLDTTGEIMEIPIVAGDSLGSFVGLIQNAVVSDPSGKNILTGTGNASVTVKSRKISIQAINNSGWNLVSAPSAYDNYYIRNLFPNSIGYAFSFADKYNYTDTLSNGVGYWLKFSTQSNDNLSGIPVSSATFQLSQGWNLIGSISDSLNTDSIIVSPTNSISSYYFGYNSGYKISNEVMPAKAYWVKAKNNCSIVLSTADNFYPNMTMTKTKYYLQSTKLYASALDSINLLKISDNASNYQNLYFGKAAVDSSQLTYFELPPKPPLGAFDARFSSNMFAEILPDSLKDSVSAQIDIQSSNYPLTLLWNIRQSEFRYYLYEIKNNSNLFLSEIKDTSTLVINDTLVSSILLIAKTKLMSVETGKSGEPSGYVLYQNYPNPFNPATVIRFKIPSLVGNASGITTLKIYNILGKEIVTLVNRQLKPGDYQIYFNASQLASGIYFYELKAGEYFSVKKMNLLK
jgi:hypothetical protein